MNKERFVVVIAALCLITVSSQSREAGNQLNTLLDYIAYAAVFRILIIRIACENSAGNLVHDVVRRSLHNHVFCKVCRKNTALAKIVRECFELSLIWKLSEKKEISALLVAELLVFFCVFNQVFYIVAAVNKAAGNCNFLVIFDFVTNYITNACKTNEYTGSVCITEASFYIILRVELLIDRVVVDSQFFQILKNCCFRFVRHHCLRNIKKCIIMQ